MMKVIRVIKSTKEIVLIPGMRKIKRIFFHCTAGPQNQPTQEIFNYWQKHNGWKNPGYHFDVSADGTIEQYMEISQVANGVANYNAESIHICYKGGIDKAGKPLDNRTDAQKKSQIALALRMTELFPNAVHLGHRDVSVDKNGNGIIDAWEFIKACPAYDHRKWMMESRIMDEVITPIHIVYKLNKPQIKNLTVEAIQVALSIKPDGFFGADTDESVRTFQKARKITDDGVVGETTAKLLIDRLNTILPKEPKTAQYTKLLQNIKNNA